MCCYSKPRTPTPRPIHDQSFDFRFTLTLALSPQGRGDWTLSRTPSYSKAAVVVDCGHGEAGGLPWGTGFFTDVLAEGSIDGRLVAAAFSGVGLEPGYDVGIEP